MKINFIFIASVFLLSGCVSQVLIESQLTNVQNGMHRSDVNVQLSNKKPKRSSEFQYSNKYYQVDLFDFMIGTSPSVSMVCTPNCIAVPTHIPITKPYVLVYEKVNQTLVVYGLINDLLESADESINKLANSAQKSLN